MQRDISFQMSDAADTNYFKPVIAGFLKSADMVVEEENGSDRAGVYISASDNWRKSVLGRLKTLDLTFVLQI